MATARSRKRSRSPQEVLQKPRGVIHPRVQKVGPEHFGIVSVDCAKARSKWMLCDFYGNVLIAPTIVAHTRAGLNAAVAQVRQALAAQALHDCLVAVERTGRYHRPVQRAFAAAGFEVRIVHPFATKQFRQPSDPGYKTDDTDLAAIHRAAVNGFALVESGLDDTWKTLQLLIGHRRDLVFTASLVSCQIREHLEAAFPGFAACFEKLWDRACAWHLVQHFAGPQELCAAGLTELCRSLDAANVRYQTPMIQRILEWAATAAAPDQAAAQHRAILLALNDDRTRKTMKSWAWSGRSPRAWSTRPTSCSCPSRASTSSAPPITPARWERWTTTPTPAASPAAPVCAPAVIRVTKSTGPTVLWSATTTASFAPPSSALPTT
jgi:transposase